MKIKTFKGGIHPDERKELSQNEQIENVFPFSKTVVIPATQGGAPNQIVVKVGDNVKKGQVIAQSDAFMSSPVHASISGVVKKVENHFAIGNTEVPCITIVSDDSDSFSYMPALDPFTSTKEENIQRIKQAGIVGMGGASFPTHVKLNPNKPIDYVLANGAECEPYLTIDERTLAENISKVIDGLAIAMHIVSGKNGIIVIEDNKSYLFDSIEKAIKDANYKSISVQLVKTKYPQGGEKMLVKAVTGREIPSGGLPADVGCVIQNVSTLVSISEAFREGKPLIERVLTVSGEGIKNPKNIRVPVGTVIKDLIPSVIEINPDVKKILSGGPMMGIAMSNADFPVQKNTSGVLFLTSKELCLLEEDPCIGCGNCIKSCPMKIYPVMMMKALNADDLSSSLKYGLMDCIECGSCAFVCPCHIKLVQRFRIGKQIFRAQMQKKKEASKKEESKNEKGKA